MTRPRITAHLLLAVGLGLGLHLWVAAGTDPVPDETWYALWSRRLGVAYPDHPPAVAWLVAAARAAAGEGTLALRLPALLGGALVPLFLAAAAAGLAAAGRGGTEEAGGTGGGREGRGAGEAPDPGLAAVRTAWIASGTLFLHVLGVVVTPDVPLALAWSAALAGAAWVWRRTRSGAPVPTAALLGLGILAGLAILSKLHGWLLLAGLLGGLAWAGAGLGRRLAWVAVGALAASAPWWLSLLSSPAGSDAAFQLARLRPTGVSAAHLPGLLAGQLALLTPVLGILAGAWMVRALRRRRPADRLLLALSLPTLAAFAAAALLRPVEANWPAPAWLAVVVGLGVQGLGRWRPAVVATSAPLVLAAHLLAVTGLPGGGDLRDPTDRLHGWSTLRPLLAGGCAGRPVVAEGYWLGAEARFWAPECDVRIVDGRRDAWIRAAGLGPVWSDGAWVLHRADRPAPRPDGCEPGPRGVLAAGGRRLQLSVLRCARASTRRLDDTAPRSAPP